VVVESNRARSYPGRVAAMKCASVKISSGSFHSKISSIASAPVMKYGSASGFSAASPRSVSMV
jgi:hypothetical protein